MANIVIKQTLVFKKAYKKLHTNEWLRRYNELRPHSGKFCYGKTPLQTFIDPKHIAIEKIMVMCFDYYKSLLIEGALWKADLTVI